MTTSWASIAKAPTPAPAAPPPAADEQRDASVLVVDANAIINGIRLEGIADRAVTIQEVLDEVRDRQSRQYLASLPFGLQVVEPSEESLKIVTRFARETGDANVLSSVDLKVLALAHALEVQAHGAAHLKEHPAQPLMKSQHRKTEEKLPGWGKVPNPEDWKVIDALEGDGAQGKSRIAAKVQSLMADETATAAEPSSTSSTTAGVQQGSSSAPAEPPANGSDEQASSSKQQAEQASKQQGEQGSKQQAEQANKQQAKQANKQQGEQASKQQAEQVSKQQGQPASKQQGAQANKQQAEQADKQQGEEADKQPDAPGQQQDLKQQQQQQQRQQEGQLKPAQQQQQAQEGQQQQQAQKKQGRSRYKGKKKQEQQQEQQDKEADDEGWEVARSSASAARHRRQKEAKQAAKQAWLEEERAASAAAQHEQPKEQPPAPGQKQQEQQRQQSQAQRLQQQQRHQQQQKAAPATSTSTNAVTPSAIGADTAIASTATPSSSQEPASTSAAGGPGVQGVAAPPTAAVATADAERIETGTAGDAHESTHAGQQQDAAAGSRGDSVGSDSSDEDGDDGSEAVGTSEYEEDEEEGDAASTDAADGSTPKGRSSVACLTADFAMQNVLLQMGLRLLTPDGRRITRLSRWALRCSACFAVTREVGRLFCPKCGNMTMDRVELTIGADGAEYYGVKKRHILRGTRYSLPKPRGGRNPNEPILREDVFLIKTKAFGKRAQRRPKKEAADAGDDPFLVGAGETGPSAWHRSQQELAQHRGLAAVLQPAWKRNPNERKGATRSSRRG